MKNQPKVEERTTRTAVFIKKVVKNESVKSQVNPATLNPSPILTPNLVSI